MKHVCNRSLSFYTTLINLYWLVQAHQWGELLTPLASSIGYRIVGLESILEVDLLLPQGDIGPSTYLFRPPDPIRRSILPR
jgi:hypothetical protein